MKALIFGTLLLVATPVWAADGTKETAAEAPVIVVERVDGEGVEQIHEVRVVTVAGDTGAAVNSGEVVIKVVVDGDSDGDVKVVRTGRVVAQVHINDEGREDRGWLGVYLGDLSKTDAMDNNIEGGIRILNVIKESPAAMAGLEGGDIITSINGQDVAAGVSELTKVIGELSPGSEARIGVIRDGQSLELTATLSKPQSGSVQLVNAPDVDFADYVAFSPNVWHFFESGEDGAFVVDDSFAWQQLPKSLRGLANINSQFDVRFGDGQRKINIKTVDDGEVLDISQDGDGPITVKRYTQGQENEANEAEYADADALEAADADAFELYDQQGSQAGFMLKFGNYDGAAFEFDTAKLGFLQEDLRKRLAAELEAVGQATGNTAQIHTAITKLQSGQDGKAPGGMFFSAGGVMESFRVNPDGEIELTLRKGDTEVVNVYSDANDLEARNPEAFSKYSSVLEATNE